MYKKNPRHIDILNPVINQIVTSYLIQLLLKVEHSLDSNTDLLLCLIDVQVGSYLETALIFLLLQRVLTFALCTCEFSHPLVNLQIKHKRLINFQLLMIAEQCTEYSIEIVFRSDIKLFSFPINSLQSCLISEICCLRVETKNLF